LNAFFSLHTLKES